MLLIITALYLQILDSASESRKTNTGGKVLSYDCGKILF